MRNTITRWLSAICISSLLSYIWPSLPPLLAIFLTTCGLTIATAIVFLRPPPLSCKNRIQSCLVIVHGFSLGAMWMASVGHCYYAWQLPGDKIQQDFIITGTVLEASCKSNRHTYTLKTDFQARYLHGSHKIKLHEQSAHACMQPHDEITATVRLKPAYGVANPIGFNYQQYLVSQNIVATGSLRQRHRQKAHPRTLRQQLQGIINRHADGNQRWLSVLLLGDKAALSDDDWSLLRRTGTGHLFSISGLHLGIVAAALLPVIGALIAVLMRIGEPAKSRGVVTVTLLLVAASTLFYAALTGAALPVIRAWLLLAAGIVLNLSHCHWNGLHKGLVMLTGCVLLFPLSTLSPGFYLSVGAVMVIWFMCWRWQWHRLRWYQCLWRLQITLSIALLPLTLGWFSMVSLSAIPINLVLVPVVTLLLPLLLSLLVSAWLIPVIAAPAMWCANQLVGSMITILITLDQCFPSPLTFFPDASVLLAVMLAFITACLPSFRFKRCCVALLLLPLILTGLPPTFSHWELHVLDAGQGTAALITRGNRGVIVDTGPSYGGNAATIEQALVPLIRRYNLKIDYVLISHEDNDHAGGSQALQGYLDKLGQDAHWLRPHNGCISGRTLKWQGLKLAMLWPPVDTSFKGNNASCVLAIEGLGHRLLLPADIERSAEYALLATNQALRADALLAPHHGSSTSSTGVFIRHVTPKLVIFTQGFENRWGFPSSDVVTRYQEMGVTMLTTSESGYIRITMRQDRPLRAQTLRHDIQPRWYRQPIKFSSTD